MLGPPPLPRTLDASIRDLSSDSAEVRKSAVYDLVRHALAGDETRARAIPLVEKLLRDPHHGVRSAAAVGLADMKAGEALPALLVAVEDEDGHVRQMALNALGEIGDPRARQRIERALTDERPEVRYQAIIAFTRVVKDASDVEPALLRAVRDDDDAIRYIALRLAEDRRSKDEGLVARARELLADPNASVALAAAIYLAASIADAGAKEIIAGVVRDGMKGAEKVDEQAAVELAGELRMAELTKDLERRAFGLGRFVRDTHAWHATIALASMGHARATLTILKDLDSARREARQAAVVAAGRARLAEAREKLERLKDRPKDTDPDLVAEALARLAPRS